jgi:hypothetical protein
MFDWIIIGVLYVAGIGFFRFLGGLPAAGDALQRWGGAYAEHQRARNRLPSIPRRSAQGPKVDR